MISDAPLLAAADMSPVSRAGAFLEAAKAAAADGLAWREFGELLVALLRTLVAAYDDVAGMDGAAKKALVLQAAGQLFDVLAIKAVPFPAVAFWVVVRPAVRSLVLAIASGAIEALLPLVRR